MKFNFYSDPFPYIIIDETFDGEEYPIIWKEISFHLNKGLTPEEYQGAKIDGKYLTNSKGLILDQLYSGNYRKLSEILTICNRKFFNQEICETILPHNSYWRTYYDSTKDITKLRRYSSGDSYEAHYDSYVHALISTTICPKEDVGGNLFFPEHDLEVETKDNRTVIFPGWIKHGVTKVLENDRYAITIFSWCDE